MKSYKFHACLAAILFVFACFSQEIAAKSSPGGMKSVVEEADSAYARGEYAKSESLYQKAIEENGATASLLFNLANACYKSGNEGYARLYLERAKRLDPSNDKIDNNLKYLSMRIDDANKAELKGKKGNVVPDEPGFFAKVGNSVAVDTSSDSWAEMAATAFILTILMLGLYFFSRNVYLKKIGFFSAIIFVCFTLVFVIFSEMAASHFENSRNVVLTSFKTSLTDEPSANSRKVGSPLHRGTKFSILDTELEPDGEIGWYKVKLNNANIGWVRASDVTKI